LRQALPRIWTFLLAVCAVWPVPAQAAPLHGQIDRLIAARAGGPVAGPASDAELLRRVTLDLAGTIPTAAETRRFLAECAAEREEMRKRGNGGNEKAAISSLPHFPISSKARARLIDRLLASPDYPRRMEQFFSVTWLERRKGDTVPDRQWSDYLREAFAANRPYDQLVREIVLADGTDPKTRPAMKFFADARGGDPHRMAQDAGRLFLGMNLQCAQCHDHPTVAEWKQADYYGLYAYLGQSRLHKDKSGATFLVEGPPAGKIAFESVFAPDTKHATGPRLPGGKEIEVPTFEKGQEFAEPPKDGMPGVPKFRPRLLLAGDLTSPQDRRFARTAVNRLWFMMMGRGLVHPLDMDHSGNRPSHPELLDLLAQEFAASGYDVKRLLREIALSQTYQRSSLLPEGVDPKSAPPQSYRVANIKPLSAEQLAWSLPQAAGMLETLLKAPAPEKPSFTYKDYINGRITEAPANMTDTLELFAAVFGNPPGEPEVEFQPSMAHSLFLMNERLILQWLSPHPGNLVERLAKLNDPAAAGEELYLSILTRPPDEEEKAEVAAYLEKNNGRRAAALADLAWALIASAEFRLNH
jgi:uncharacterized protein DUF1553/uncharacterized protein DUF1549